VQRKAIDLNGREWRLGRAPTDARAERADWAELGQIAEWLPAQVPGAIHADLVDAGLLEDPCVSFDAGAFREISEANWWLVRDFGTEPRPDERARLVLRGIDYIGDVFVNGQALGRHEGMFSAVEHDITGLLRGENRLAVRLLGTRWLPRSRSTVWEKLLNRAEARWGGLPGDYPDRRDTLKCQMQFGWDFSPPLLTLGLWDDVCVRVSGRTWIGALHATYVPDAQGTAGRLDMRLWLGGEARPLRILARLEGATRSGAPLCTERSVVPQPGGAPLLLSMHVPQPLLWWPWDHGEPTLCRLSVEAWDGDQMLDRRSESIGLRQVEVVDYSIRVNGEPVYARGANWVPASVFPGRVRSEEYARLVGMARDAKMNMLRVWGGGLREKQAFYDECDRQGILVWQEFPLACAFLTRFPRSPEYLDLAGREGRGIVRDLRNHACLAAWAGGNELSPRRNAPVLRVLREAVESEDGTRSFFPASPYGGDHHNWQVWHSFHPPSHYVEDDAVLASELGLQCPPSLGEMQRFLTPAQLWPPGDAWTLRGAGLEKLWRYARPFLPAPLRDCARPAWHSTTASAFVEASQQAQLQGLKIAIEHFRRRKAAGCGGILIWQLNEPWPAISWAVIPHKGEPKPAFRALTELFDPLMVSLAYPLRPYRAGAQLEASVWVINDTASQVPGCEVRADLCDGDGRQQAAWRRRVDVPAHSASTAGTVSWALPEGPRWLVRCSLARDGKTLASNEYDLGMHDGIQPAPGQRMWAWLSGLVSRL
jgi:beta-mannosidase